MSFGEVMVRASQSDSEWLGLRTPHFPSCIHTHRPHTPIHILRLAPVFLQKASPSGVCTPALFTFIYISTRTAKLDVQVLRPGQKLGVQF